MKKKSKSSTAVWVVYFVGFDDENEKPGSPSNSHIVIEPRVGFEKFETNGDEAQQKQDAEMAAFLRGGQLLAIVEDDDERIVQSVAAALEKQILRMR
jgi:hypothetical protein